MKKVFAITVALLLGSFGLAYAAASKVDVCHRTSAEDNAYVIITIADAAYDTHIGHGDLDVDDDGSCGDGGDPGDPI
jgi:hypothetical protein